MTLCRHTHTPTLRARTHTHTHINTRTRIHTRPPARTHARPHAHMQSSSCWATFTAHTAVDFSFYLMLTELPSYLKVAVGMSGKDAAYASALPYLFMLIFSIGAGAASDKLIASGTLSVVGTRKLMVSIALVGSAFCFLAAGFAAPPLQHRDALLGAQQGWVTMGLGILALASPSYNSNYIEIGGRFSGVLSAMGNTFATLPGILAPVLTGLVVDAHGCVTGAHVAECRAAYQEIFLLIFGINVVGAGVFVAFASSHPIQE